VQRIGIDIGGTFTDITLVRGDGSVELWKQDTTPEDPVQGVEAGLRGLSSHLGLDLEALMAETELVIHGTTIATNTVIQRNGPRLGLLCTNGFRDIIYLRDGFKPERFNMHLAHPRDLVERVDRIPIPERIGPSGEVLIELDEEAVRQGARTLARAGVGALAVAFLWSVVNPEHELRAAEIARAEMPGVPVLCSSEILPEIREWERTTATLISAYVAPGLDGYLRRFEQLLRTLGHGREPLIMQVNGGCASVDELLRRPVYGLASGPAAAPAAALYDGSHAGDGAGLITADMGGTSFDVSMVRAGRPAMSRDLRVDEQPLGVSGVDVHSIGAGGGSVAWVDSGGALRVGPESTGAVPGPACYGVGEKPTVTDANVVLGYLQPSAFLGGRRSLDARRSAAAIERDVASPLSIDLVSAAAGILAVADANMVGAIRAVSTERGIDPRAFALVAGGGAGGLHAARLARALGIKRVIVQPEAGTLCSFGMTVTDVRCDVSAALHSHLSEVDRATVGELFTDLTQRATSRLAAQGFSGATMSLHRSVDARYPGQLHELTVPIEPVEGREFDRAAVLESFHELHRAQFTYDRREIEDLELLHWRVEAIAALVDTASQPGAGPAATEPASDGGPTGSVRAWFPELGWQETDTWAAPLVPGLRVPGPAIVQAPTTTVLVNHGDTLTVGNRGVLVIETGTAD
jgi:N-methylhydantoinase A